MTLSLSLTLLLSSSALGLVAPPTRLRPATARHALPTQVPSVFKGIHIPRNGIFVGQGTIASTVIPELDWRVAGKVVGYLVDSRNPNKMIAKKKDGKDGYDTNVREWLDLFLKHATDANDMPASYKVFGGDDFAQALCVYLESNPFITAALTSNGDNTFAVNTFREPGAQSETHFQKVIATMQGNRKGRPEVNIKFAAKPGGGLAIDSMRVRYPGSDAIVAADPSEYNDLASAALFELIFFASSEHATIHVLHYLLTNALKSCTRKRKFPLFGKRLLPDLARWAEDYVKHIPIKYFEVGAILINKKKKGDAAITGRDGFGGSPAMIDLLVERLNAWGAANTSEEFLANGWLAAPRADLERAGLLTEFFKHVDLGTKFSEEVCATLEPAELERLDAELTKFTMNCGSFRHATTLKNWVQVMTTTGVIHAGTLSYSRSMMRGGVARWRNADSDVWDKNDKGLMQKLVGTTTGMEHVKKVMTSKEEKRGRRRNITDGALQTVLKKYDAQQVALQEAYQKRVEARPDFDDVGFILSDYCTTGFDGKQLTIATYI